MRLLVQPADASVSPNMVATPYQAKFVKQNKQMNIERERESWGQRPKMKGPVIQPPRRRSWVVGGGASPSPASEVVP